METVAVDARELAGAASLTLVAIFSLAAAEKFQTVRSRAAPWHPVMLAIPQFRRQAALLMTLSLVADLSTIALLIARPSLGAPTSIVLITTYSAAGVFAHQRHEDGCRCFWNALNTSTRFALVIRNGLLVGLAYFVFEVPGEITARTWVWMGAFLVVLSQVVRWSDSARRQSFTDEPRPTPQTLNSPTGGRNQ